MRYLASGARDVSIGLILLAATATGLMSGCQTLSTSDAAAHQVERSYADEGEFRSWFAFYYREPKPGELGAALRYMEANRYLADFPDIASVFVANVMKAHPQQLGRWTESWHDLGPRAWNVIVLSLWLSDTREGLALAKTHLSRVTPAERQRFAGILARDPQSAEILTSEISSPRQINMLWAGFSATGDRRYVDKIISYVHLYGTEQDPNAAALGEAAIITLATNSMQHETVARSCTEANASHPDPRTRTLLRAMLTAVAQMMSEGQGGQETRPAH